MQVMILDRQLVKPLTVHEEKLKEGCATAQGKLSRKAVPQRNAAMNSHHAMDRQKHLQLMLLLLPLFVMHPPLSSTPCPAGVTFTCPCLTLLIL